MTSQHTRGLLAQESNPNVFAKVDQVIQGHIMEFQKPRVLTVRPGYEVVVGRLTRVPGRRQVRAKQGQGAADGSTWLPADFVFPALSRNL